MLCYKDMTFCSARCDNVKCHRKIGYSDMRRAEKMDIPVAFADFGNGCKDRFEDGSIIRAVNLD